MLKYLIAVSLYAFSGIAAANAVSNPAVTPIGYGSVLNLVIAMIAILGMIILSAYAMKRFNMMTWNKGPIKLLTGVSLGTKERIMLIEVGGQQLLIAVSPAGIETLHVFAEPINVDLEENKPSSAFVAALSKAMSKRTSL